MLSVATFLVGTKIILSNFVIPLKSVEIVNLDFVRPITNIGAEVMNLDFVCPMICPSVDIANLEGTSKTKSLAFQLEKSEILKLKP